MSKCSLKEDVKQLNYNWSKSKIMLQNISSNTTCKKPGVGGPISG